MTIFYVLAILKYKAEVFNHQARKLNRKISRFFRISRCFLMERVSSICRNMIVGRKDCIFF